MSQSSLSLADPPSTNVLNDVILPELNPIDLRNWTTNNGSHQSTGSTSVSQSQAISQSKMVNMQPADTTVQENAVTAQKIVDSYLKMTTPPVHRRDMNYGFPPGLFQSDVDLEGSAQAYHSLIEGLENCSDIQQLLNQVDADPFRSTSIFSELDLDIFD